ncbi:hypothetical protein DINM_004388 [Dirofilaria immitis]|nr:hypothetical protein [Dirofilaria immitis]
MCSTYRNKDTPDPLPIGVITARVLRFHYFMSYILVTHHTPSQFIAGFYRWGVVHLTQLMVTQHNTKSEFMMTLGRKWGHELNKTSKKIENKTQEGERVLIYSATSWEDDGKEGAKIGVQMLVRQLKVNDEMSSHSVPLLLSFYCHDSTPLKLGFIHPFPNLLSLIMHSLTSVDQRKPLAMNTAADDVERNFVNEISNRNKNDTMQDSLNEEAISLLNIRKPMQTDISEKELTSLDYQSNTSTPNTVKNTRNVSSDATPVAAAFSEGKQKLKAEVFDLKSQMFMLRRNLPSILDNEGKDFIEEYLTIQTELDNEKVRRVEMEQIWHSQKKEFDEERSKFESERYDWEKKCERLLMDRDELVAELKELHQQLSERRGERDDGSESQGDSSLSTISLISERGIRELHLKLIIPNVVQEIERLRSVVLQQSLQEQLKLAQDSFAKQTAHYMKEKMRSESLKVEMTKLQEIADEAKQEVEYQKQNVLSEFVPPECIELISEEQLAKAYAINEVALNKRDRAIRILLKKLKSNAETSSSSKFEGNDSCLFHRDIPNLNPYAQGILDQINEFTVENDVIRNKVIEWGVMNIDLTSEIEPSETPSVEDENSEWNTKRCERENEKLAAFLAQNKTISDGSNEEEVGGKLALFDAINSSGEKYSKELLNDTARNMGASEMLNITSTAELLSKSLVLTEDLGEVKKKLSVLQSSCARLFEKLRGTANFLQTLLDELGAGDRGKELLAEIEGLRIDLDHSLTTAIDISHDVEAAEESIGNLSAHLQRSLLNCSFGISSVASNENQQNASALSRAHRAYRRLNADLANEKMKANEVIELNEKLQAHITDLQDSKQKLVDELDDLKKKSIEKENEMISSMKDIETQLQHKNQQYDELYREVQELQQEIKAKEIFVATREAEMEQLTDQMAEKCRELENQKLLIDVESYNNQLLSHNNELIHYRNEIIGVDNKMCQLISVVKESLGIVVEQVDKPIIETANAELGILARLSQIGADIEEFTKVSHYIADLRNQMIKLQQDLDLCERNRSVINTKCHGLSKQNAYLEAERNEAKQKLLALQQQVQMEKESVKMIERDLQRLKSENSYVKENNERLTNMLVSVEAKYEELISKSNCICFSERQCSERYTVTIGTMTVLSSHDFLELNSKAKTLSSFMKRMYALAARWNDKATVISKISYKSTDLDHLYHTYAQILRRLSDGLNELRNKITSDRVKLQSIISDEQQNPQKIGIENSRSDNDELDAPLSSLNSYLTRNIRSKPFQHNAEVLEVLSNMRSLRFQIDWLRKYSHYFKKTKENVAPMEALQLENERLQAVVVDARILLQRAHERLSKLPNSREMCDQILREMSEIGKAMKATTREFYRSLPTSLKLSISSLCVFTEPKVTSEETSLLQTLLMRCT